MAKPSEPEQPNQPELLATAFGAILRGAGLVITTRRVLSFTQALRQLGANSRDDVYWAGRATLVSNPAHFTTFNRAFAVFWEQKSAGTISVELPPITLTLATDTDQEDESLAASEDTQQADGPTLRVRYSHIETLKSKDFALCSEAELAELYELLPQLRFNVATRQSRRQVPTRHRSRHPDLRRTIRQALATGGEPIRRRFLVKDRRIRKVVLLVDISGSMEPYARALVRFAHAAVLWRARTEIFTIGTRLTRVTRELSSRDPDKSIAAASQAVEDWSGGTRLGEVMAQFNDLWGVRGMGRGAIVVIVSDGWDRGDPTELSEQMQRLARITHKLVWVNPLKHTDGYAPLARGMAAALPYLDEFIEGHSFDSLEHLAELLDA